MIDNEDLDEDEPVMLVADEALEDVNMPENAMKIAKIALFGLFAHRDPVGDLEFEDFFSNRDFSSWGTGRARGVNVFKFSPEQLFVTLAHETDFFLAAGNLRWVGEHLISLRPMHHVGFETHPLIGNNKRSATKVYVPDVMTALFGDTDCLATKGVYKKGRPSQNDEVVRTGQICGDSKCIAMNHLVLELPLTNASRRICHGDQGSVCAHIPICLRSEADTSEFTTVPVRKMASQKVPIDGDAVEKGFRTKRRVIRSTTAIKKLHALMHPHVSLLDQMFVNENKECSLDSSVSSCSSRVPLAESFSNTIAVAKKNLTGNSNGNYHKRKHHENHSSSDETL